MLITFLKGVGTGGGLIIAIGAQNAFVLSQGIRRNHVLLIPLICSMCDGLLIAIGIAGIGTAIASNTLLSTAASLGGAIFLLWSGIGSFRSAFRGGSLITETSSLSSIKAATLTTLAVTLLNPHVYIDTIILMGSLSSQLQGQGRLLFGAGAVTASFIWFFSLSLGARLLVPVFKKKISWRILDSLVGITMWAIAVSIIKDFNPLSLTFG